MNHITDCLTTETVQAFATMTRKARRVAVTCHLSPDGDALGSSLGVAGVLRKLGKEVTVVLPDSPAATLRFIPGCPEAVVATVHPRKAEWVIRTADLILCMDFNALHRIDRLAEAVAASRCPKILIDHHIQPEQWPALTISSPMCSSTCLLLYHLLRAAGMAKLIDKSIATCIYTGMMTDTGNFSYNANDPDIYRIIADLMDYGIDKNEIYRRAMGTSTLNSIRLCAYALYSKMTIYEEARLAVITLDNNELELFGYHRGDTESLVNKPLEIPEIRWSVFMRQDNPERVKVSMRSIGSFGVNSICARLYGGGGHHNAAGGDWFGSIEDALAQLTAVLPEYAGVMAEAVKTDSYTDPFKITN